MIGTFANVGAVIFGSILGLLINKKLPERFTKIVFQAIGLFTIFIGVVLSLKSEKIIVVFASLVLGAVIGELINIETQVDDLANYVNKKFKTSNSKFKEGLITAFLLYCMGSMTILGAIEDGLGHTPDLLYIKSIMDGISSIALASAFGIGVLFSVVPLLIYQGGISVFASYLDQYLSESVINELSATGGVILIGLGISILEIKKIKTLNLTPALIVAIILAMILV